MRPRVVLLRRRVLHRRPLVCQIRVDGGDKSGAASRSRASSLLLLSRKAEESHSVSSCCCGRYRGRFPVRVRFQVARRLRHVRLVRLDCLLRGRVGIFVQQRHSLLGNSVSVSETLLSHSIAGFDFAWTDPLGNAKSRGHRLRARRSCRRARSSLPTSSTAVLQNDKACFDGSSALVHDPHAEQFEFGNCPPPLSEGGRFAPC